MNDVRQYVYYNSMETEYTRKKKKGEMYRAVRISDNGISSFLITMSIVA